MLTKRFFKTKAEAEVTFEISVSEADNVALVAEFTDWQPMPMKYVKKDNVYRTKVRLPIEQQFHFRYLIDDSKWENDHQADAYICNSFGTDNSVVSTMQC
ncbi:isoamylase early set domain-containing protein [Pseudoalteromonas tunicata]|jgi:1,4-alpha-glucan branching enzyme|uniref:1,4-alpha-glucan branching enzyme n=1 Tax=Pseudoalteromonas tunicata D2 TaxID=87626 RepID=A4C4D1_9GAMM|nr:isoamylase early set domain-containing protein [Pseudoalteromonas tunicata]ATC97104.1 hypothetical protein PTUN_b0764 [Pseudoalteromonas tunicata]AXT33213.1 1,4-alpha-glucan branching protein [Pseudoalteromonas tunicata]EAR30413.1 hypothetical protein PTD2_02551 [Pseudoalteromonas tunicata D2]MDP4982108.1 isoamylase early set domain-containing protein [Pseudoalteromonas tunicata]MDP5215218.1 isoamylase early set domain-containing protein [Pseudoalteromonas tunicata]